VGAGGAVFRREPELPLELPASPVAPTPVPEPAPDDGPEAAPVTEAREAFARGDFARAAELAATGVESPRAAALRVRALANIEPMRAESECAAALDRHAHSAELHLLRGMLLARLGRDRDALAALRATLALDATLAIAHYALGAVLHRLGRPAGARRAYRNARRLCRRWPAESELPLSDGQPTGWVSESARAQLELLDLLQSARRSAWPQGRRRTRRFRSGAVWTPSGGVE
jgi:chemotaxis protein methyltransferase CheR